MTPEPSNEYQELVEAVAGAVLAEWNDERPCHDKCANETAKHCACAKDTAEAALSALKPSAGDDGWQDIATAPKKGLIDIWIKRSDGGVRWTDCYYDSICGEWRTTGPSGHLVSVKERFVTHWRPLPTPPAKGTPHV